jgi:sodium-independent sulfate anion transporter 11
LPRYNKTWLFGDIISGITVGLLLVPQALAYAKLAGVPLEFGLYTSVTGVLIYWIFSTSKDVTTGPTAVLSQLCGQVLATYNIGADKVDPVVFLVSVSFLSGIIEMLIGFLQLGIIIDFIPTPVIVGFTSGAAVSIISGQVAGLLGIRGIDTNNSAHMILYNTFKSIGSCKADAFVGISALAILILFRLITRFFIKRGYSWFSWVGQSSNAIVIVLFTIISYSINSGKKTPLFRIVGNVPQGLNYFKVPELANMQNILSASAAVVLVSVLEHVAISKSFGRLNGYTPDINQEIIAMGVTNTLGSFLGAFSATGSFSRSSINSRSGAKSPLAGLFTAGVMFLSLYVVTPAFFYIPNSVLSAMIINAITDLMSRPAALKELWEIEFLDFLAFALAFFVTIFVSIETAIYCSVAFAVIVLLYRVARPKVGTLARDNSGGWSGIDELKQYTDDVDFSPAPPGIAVFRIEEALSYPNASYVSNYIKTWVENNTLYNISAVKSDEQLWCNKNTSYKPIIENEFGSNGSAVNILPLPILEAIVFDFSAVNGIDATGLQTLVDIKREVENYSGGRVLFYFAHVHPQFRRVLQYFLLNLRPNFEIVSVVANAETLDPKAEQVITRIEDQRREIYGSSSVYTEQFIFRTIDQAVADAVKRTSEAISRKSQ